MFGPSPPCDAATMASADSCPPSTMSPDVARRRSFAPTTGEQVSRGKTRDLRPMYPPHIRPRDPGGIGLRVSVPSRPSRERLVCGSCSSGRGFACSCLPTTPRDDAVAVRLGVPATETPGGLAPPSHFPVLFRSPVDSAVPGAPRHARRTQEERGTLTGPPLHTTVRSGSTYFSMIIFRDSMKPGAAMR